MGNPVGRVQFGIVTLSPSHVTLSAANCHPERRRIVTLSEANCHPEPFAALRINSAKGLKILRLRLRMTEAQLAAVTLSPSPLSP